MSDFAIKMYSKMHILCQNIATYVVFLPYFCSDVSKIPSKHTFVLLIPFFSII